MHGRLSACLRGRGFAVKRKVMSEISQAASAKPYSFERFVKPFLTPYYFVVVGVLGALVAAIAAVTVLVIIVAANFNVLGWME